MIRHNAKFRFKKPFNSLFGIRNQARGDRKRTIRPFNSLFGIPTTPSGFTRWLENHFQLPFRDSYAPRAPCYGGNNVPFNSLFGIRGPVQPSYGTINCFQLPFRDSEGDERELQAAEGFQLPFRDSMAT